MNYNSTREEKRQYVRGLLEVLNMRLNKKYEFFTAAPQFPDISLRSIVDCMDYWIITPILDEEVNYTGNKKHKEFDVLGYLKALDVHVTDEDDLDLIETYMYVICESIAS